MNDTHLTTAGSFGVDDESTLPLRTSVYTDVLGTHPRSYRSLKASELEILVLNGNTAADWNDVRVSDGFDPNLVHRCSFFGIVRIGALEPVMLRFHDLSLPVGLSDSLIVSSDIGDNVVIRNVRYLARYVIANEVMLFNIDEMGATDHAKFGNGIIKEGEGEEVRVKLEIANENGGRAVLAFDSMLTGDAHLWSQHRADAALQAAFRRMTDSMFDKRRGIFASVADRAVIKSCRIIKDVKIGPWAYIKGANKLKNLTINSSRQAPTQIGEGVELVNGIIEQGSRVFYGVKAVRFVMRTNTCLKYGARLINSILGDNGTISCCEVLNSLVMPGHEQHHNNSFLCAATVLGQSNIAAGATLGSNHNSRANDGELVAGRGFWPALTVSLKHSSRFASFCLIAKGSYPAELNIPLVFALVSTEPERLVLRPAFWFFHNMYALARNSWKYTDRDARLYRHHEFEYEYLAPDTVTEILESLELLELWVGTSPEVGELLVLPEDSFGGRPNITSDAARESYDRAVITGSSLLKQATSDPERPGISHIPRRLIIRNAGMEKTSRDIEIRNLPEAWVMYRRMAVLYGIKALLSCMEKDTPLTIDTISAAGLEANALRWSNIGGQLIRSDDVDTLLDDIRSGRLGDWNEVHHRYEEIASTYRRKRGEHGIHVLCTIAGVSRLDEATLNECKRIAADTQDYIEDETRRTREKDYENPFRTMMYDSIEEMNEVIGAIDDNSFISLITEESAAFRRRLES